jgi:hypothetical protein
MLLQTFQKKIQVFWDTVSHMHCSLRKTTDETSTLISEVIGISLSALNDIFLNWLTDEAERKRMQQQNIGR